MRVDTDVVVVGAGNAGLVAALAARDAGARVIVLEAAGRDERGGNSRFSGGIFRTVHDGLSSLEPLLHASSGQWLERVHVRPYTRDDYERDWTDTSAGRASQAMIAAVVDGSFETLQWMHGKGVEWELTADKLFDPDKLDPSMPYALPPGGAVRARGEGQGLVKRLFAAAEAAGVEIWYDAPAAGLITSGSTVKGVRVRRPDDVVDVRGTVVLASGGFESNPEMRLRYLGPGWDLVKVRGTRFNMGTMLTQALLAGAQPAGHWGGAHAAPIDAAAPPVGDLRLTDKMSRYSYPYSLLVNRLGDRFVDEGEDEVWLTYAKTGWAIRAQEQGVAYQIFDQKTVHLLEPRYSTGAPIVSASIEGLAAELGMAATGLRDTVATFNASVASDALDRFKPFERDGVVAVPAGQPPKSNWALAIDRPPFVAYPVTCGITFTYGGLKVNTRAEVLDTEGRPMSGLYATGEIAGDFFFHNYAAGSGLMRGAVFGRLAGANAAARATAGGDSGRSGTLPVVLMRGGTSKGVFVHAEHLPPAGPERDGVILDLMGSPDPMQIDGLGGTYSSTSKFVAVEPGVPPDDITYWFAQVGVDRPIVDWSGNCGNLTTAVGPFAIDEGLVPAVEPMTVVRMRNGNTGAAVLAEVPVRKGRACVEGAQVVPGVPGTGAAITTRYLDPAGGVLGAALPTGAAIDTVRTADGTFDVSIVDVTHPYAMVDLHAAGLGARVLDPAVLNQDHGLLARLEAIRAACTVALRIVDEPAEAVTRSPVVPRLALLARPGDDESGAADLVTLAVSMGKVHRALPMTAALCCAAACYLPGTVAAGLCPPRTGDVVRLRHPRGIVEVVVDADGAPSSPAIRSVGVVRTARRLLAGEVYLRSDGTGAGAI